jgi:hypothetical protein
MTNPTSLHPTRHSPRSLNSPKPALYFEAYPLTHHVIIDSLIDMGKARLDIFIGSYVDATQTRTPFKTTVLSVQYENWLPEYFDQMVQTVHAHPQWTGLPPHAPNEHCLFHWPSQQWRDPRLRADVWRLVRTKRNQLIAASDWTQLPDVPLLTKEAWVTYRQALRDLTSQADPHRIEWPTPPDVAQAAALAMALTPETITADTSTPPDPSV